MSAQPPASEDRAADGRHRAATAGPVASAGVDRVRGQYSLVADPLLPRSVRRRARRRGAGIELAASPAGTSSSDACWLSCRART